MVVILRPIVVMVVGIPGHRYSKKLLDVWDFEGFWAPLISSVANETC